MGGTFSGARVILAKYDAGNYEKGRKIYAIHLAGFPAAFAKFQKIAGLVSWGDTDIRVINIDATDWENA